MGISFLSRMCISSNIKPKQRIKMPLNAKYNKCKGMCVLWHSNSAEYSLLAPLARTFPAVSKAGLLMLFLLILQGFFPIWTSFPSLWIYLALSQSHLFFFFFFGRFWRPACLSLLYSYTIISHWRLSINIKALQRLLLLSVRGEKIKRRSVWEDICICQLFLVLE